MKPFAALWITLFTCCSVYANSQPLPLFIAGLVHNHKPTEVRTLSSFELEASLRLHPEVALPATYEAQMKLQFKKLRQLMPYRSAKLESDWKTYFSSIESLLKPIEVPAGVDWGHWIQPVGETLKPLAVSYVTFDGRWVPFLNQELFPLLSATEKAQVIWQLLWSYELSLTDNLQTRIISNYLFSSEWNTLTLVNSFDLFKKLGFNYFESNGFCFDYTYRPEFSENSTVKKGWASDQCLIEYQNQKVRFTGELQFSEDSKLTSGFSVSPLTPWFLQWNGQNLKIRKVIYFYKTDIISSVYSFDNDCANADGPFVFKTKYADVTADCASVLSFYESSDISHIFFAKAVAEVQGKNYVMNGEPGKQAPIYFHPNGRISGGYFPAGTRLKTNKNSYRQHKEEVYYNLDADGLVISDN